MRITLYKHNSKAYRSAMDMLDKYGKAAVIHPTGTGKSFIGFKICEDHPDKKICWLSPSRYIYDTQLENLAESSGGYRPENVEFITYARLMNYKDAEIEEIKPDYIVLDEFHRCGALSWGQGVDKLLRRYDDVPLLGLSATAIRYLDNQRDMSDEIFDGHVASTMTLGEAIVRGILNPPKYVQYIYSYLEELEKYEVKISRMKNKKRRKQAEEYLEKLKRALDKAEGLDVIFDKHMTDRHGKYIVFCANYEAMQDAMGKISEWFYRIDKKPNVYSFYTEDPTTSFSFTQFKEDDDSEHLRLLFCIDALNEGVHVEDVSGVILLRPTVSPIIYKQQIGRALSASKHTTPVIFDVVNNIENLYSIDAIKEEMDEAVYQFRNSNGDDIVNETFEVVDELHDCISLFDSLENSLTASWDIMYVEAKKYYKEHGDLLPVLSYETETGYALGRWISTQRVNKRKHDLSLTSERIELLNEIGMNWESAEDRLWNTFYSAASDYYDKNGNLDIPAEYVTDDGIKLGRIYRGFRMKYVGGGLSDEKKLLLEQIGMEENSVLVRKWMTYYEEAKRFFEENGHLTVPHNYVANDLKLGVWVSSQRESYQIGRLSEEQINLLNDIGMSWDRYESKWENGFSYAKRFIEEYGDINSVPQGFCYDDFRLFVWIRMQRARKREGKLSDERIKKLESIGLHWDKNQAFWESGYAHTVEYLREHGSLKMPAKYVCEDGFKLWSWVNNQKVRIKKGTLSPEKVEKLKEIGL